MVVEVIIYGAGETGIMIAEEIREGWNTSVKIEGFVDDKITSHKYFVPIIGTGADLPRIREERGLINIVMGFPLPARKRLDIARRLLVDGFSMPAIIDEKKRHTYEVEVGQGVLVSQLSKICPGVKLGNFSMVNYFSTIEKSVIGDGVLVSPHCFIGYGAEIGEATEIYPNASIMPGVKIGRDCKIGMNLAVHRDLKDGEVYLGRERRQQEKA